MCLSCCLFFKCFLDLLDGDGDGDGTGMNPRWRMSAAPILVALGAPVRRRDVVAVDSAV